MIGKKINELRMSRGWTTRVFAKKLGVTQGMVIKYESGQSRPRPEKLVKISTIFEVSLAELTNSKPIKITGIIFDPKRYEQSIADSRQLDEESKTLINLMIDELLEKKKLKDYKDEIQKLAKNIKPTAKP